MLGTVYRVAFKRTSTFFFTVAIGALIFERTLDIGAQAAFEKINEGKLWKDIKHLYEK